MRYDLNNLDEAYDVATRLEYETKDGGLGVDSCPTCHEHVFAVEGFSSDSVIAYGYCINPDCRFERSKDEAEDEAFEARVAREE